MKTIQQIKEDYLMDLISEEQFLSSLMDINIIGESYYYTMSELLQLIRKSEGIEILTGLLTLLEKTFEQFGVDYFNMEEDETDGMLIGKINFICDELDLELSDLSSKIPHTYQLLFVDKSN